MIIGRMARGSLRIYLGAAPGVGKTFAMLGEAHRRAAATRGVRAMSPAAPLTPQGRMETAERSPVSRLAGIRELQPAAGPDSRWY